MVALRLSLALASAAAVASATGVGAGVGIPRGVSADGWVTRGSVALKDLSVGRKGRTVGVSTKTSHVLHHRASETDPAADQWLTLGGTALRALAARSSCSGAAWMLAEDGKLHRMPDFKGAWQHFAAPAPFKAFGVGNGVDVWALDGAGKPWRYNAATKTWASTEAKLSSVDVACDGTVVGTTADNTVWRFVAATGKWQAAAKGVRQVSARGGVELALDASNNVFKIPKDRNGRATKMVNMKRKANVVAAGPAPGNRLWILDLNGAPFEFTGLIAEAKLNVAERAALEAKQGGAWSEIKVDGGVKAFDAGSDGDMYALTRAGQVLFRAGGSDASAASSSWVKVKSPAGLVQLSVGCDGATVFAVSDKNLVYKYAGSGRWNVFSEKLKSVSVGAGSDQVWGVNVANRLVRWKPSSRTFVVERGVNVRSVGANCDGTVWIVTRRGRLFERSLRNPRLRFRGRNVRRVSPSPAGVYILDTKHFLFRYRRPSAGQNEGRRNWKLLHKQLRQVSVDGKGNLFGLSVSGELQEFKASGSDPEDFGWKSLRASLDDVCLGSAGSVYGLDRGTVLHLTAARTWAVVPGVSLSQISCGCDGSVVGVKGPGLVYRYRSAQIGWERLPNSAMIKSVTMGSTANKMFGVSHADQPMQWDSETSTWNELKGSVKSLAATCSNDLWGVGTNGDVLNLDEVTGHWAKLGKGARSVTAGRGVYVIGKNFKLFKYDTERKRNRWVALGPARVAAAGDDGAVIALSRSRRAMWVTKGTMIAPGPEVPPVLQHDPTADLPGPEPDNVPVSGFVPGEEPQLGAMDDMDTILSGKVALAVAAKNEGSTEGDITDPEPYRPDGSDPDDPDSKGPAEGPSVEVSQSFDPATDSARPIDESDPR
jgi:hypothetical protein